MTERIYRDRLQLIHWKPVSDLVTTPFRWVLVKNHDSEKINTSYSNWKKTVQENDLYSEMPKNLADVM